MTSSAPAALVVSRASSVIGPPPQGKGAYAAAAGKLCAAAGRADATRRTTRSQPSPRETRRGWQEARRRGELVGCALERLDKFHPPVLRPAGARAVGRDRVRLSVAFGPEAIARHAPTGQGLAHRFGALAAEPDVELGRSDVVGVA